MFGDNESVVKSGSIPHSRLNKRHVALSYHSVREAIASGIISFSHIPGVINPSDILSKHWGYQQVWPTLKPVLFWEGDTADLLREEHDPSQRKGSNKNSVITSHEPGEGLTGVTDDVSDNAPITSKPVHEPDNNCRSNNKAGSKCVRENATTDNAEDPKSNDKDPKDP
jgi:hypothetical protein